MIDETPETVVISSFDGVRREVGRLTLERLIADGRIQPAACEAAYEESVAEIDDVMIDAAEGARCGFEYGELFALPHPLPLVDPVKQFVTLTPPQGPPPFASTGAV